MLGGAPGTNVAVLDPVAKDEGSREVDEAEVDIAVTNWVVNAVETAKTTFADPGDGVFVFTAINVDGSVPLEVTCEAGMWEVEEADLDTALIKWVMKVVKTVVVTFTDPGVGIFVVIAIHGEGSVAPEVVCEAGLLVELSDVAV